MIEFEIEEHRFVYDHTVDVLHVNNTKLNPFCEYGEDISGLENFIVLMKDFNTNEITGAKIFGAKKNLQNILDKLNKGTQT